MKKWRKYLFKQLFITFISLLALLFFLYVIIDLSEHSVGLFKSEGISIKNVFVYYSHTFLVFLDFFFPLAFLLASLKILLDLNAYQELVALQMAGISKRQILFPFFVFAAILSFFSYFSGEYLIPQAQQTVDTFRNTHAKKKKKIHEEHLHAVSLLDQSELLYQTHDLSQKTLFDVIWLRSKKEIWRIHTLHLDTLLGEKVDLISHNGHQWKKETSFSERTMKEIEFENEMIEKFIPVSNRSLFCLFRQLGTHLPDKPVIEAHFFYKLMRPLLSFFVIFTLPPFALRMGRGRSYWTLIAISLAAFFGFMTILDGMLLIGETALLPPSMAILSPFILLLLLRFRSFIQM